MLNLKSTEDLIIKELLALDYLNIKLDYDLSYSQGSGFSFTADILPDLHFRIIRDNPAKFDLLSKPRHKHILENIVILMNKSYSRYSHLNTVSLEIIVEFDDRLLIRAISRELDLLVELVELERINLCKEYFTLLRNEYDEITDSDIGVKLVFVDSDIE